MGFIKKIIKAIKTWWFERQLKKNYVPDTYVYEDDEIFERNEESQDQKYRT